MKFGREILGLLLIAALVTATATLPTGAWAESDHAASAPAQSPAGCHAHAGKRLPDSQNSRSPRPAPVSYQCCLTGHDAAAVRVSLVPQSSGQATHIAPGVEPELSFLSDNDLKVAMVLSAHPPGSSPLRI